MGIVDTRKIRPFLKRVVRRFRPTRIILFGSRAKGTWTRDSDFDVVVIADSFRGIRPIKRMQGVSVLAGMDPFSLDVICFTPEEYASAKDNPLGGVAYVAEHEGVDILPRVVRRRRVIA